MTDVKYGEGGVCRTCNKSMTWIDAVACHECTQYEGICLECFRKAGFDGCTVKRCYEYVLCKACIPTCDTCGVSLCYMCEGYESCDGCGDDVVYFCCNDTCIEFSDFCPSVIA